LGSVRDSTPPKPARLGERTRLIKLTPLPKILRREMRLSSQVKSKSAQAQAD